MTGGRGFVLLCPSPFVLLCDATEMELNSFLGPFDADQDEVLLFRGQSVEVPVLKGFHPRAIKDDIPYGIVAVHAGASPSMAIVFFLFAPNVYIVSLK